MALSYLDDRDEKPDDRVLDRALGPSREAWDHLIAVMEGSYGPLSEEWNYAGAKYGWSLRLRAKKRTILYLIPQIQNVLVGVVLGDRALAGLRRDDVTAATLTLIDEAPRYGEGTGFRVPVASSSDCADLEVIIEAKMS